MFKMLHHIFIYIFLFFPGIFLFPQLSCLNVNFPLIYIPGYRYIYILLSACLRFGIVCFISLLLLLVLLLLLLLVLLLLLILLLFLFLFLFFKESCAG